MQTNICKIRFKLRKKIRKEKAEGFFDLEGFHIIADTKKKERLPRKRKIASPPVSQKK